MGRRKIEIQPLTDDRNRTVTFVKRKAGLFKKAHELAVLCQVDLAVIIVGNNNKLYEFSSVDTNKLIDMYKKTKVPHESKSPANYGGYKKKRQLSTRDYGLINDDDDDDIDDKDLDGSDYDSDSPEPKRYKPSSNRHPNSRGGAPRHISLSNVPNFNSFKNNPIKEEDEERHQQSIPGIPDPGNSLAPNSNRPVLRVQIPTDAKGNNNDSARTLTALDTNLNNTNPNETPTSAKNSSSDNSNTGTNPRNPPNITHSNTSISSENNGKHRSNAPPITTPKFSNFNTFKSPDTKKAVTALPLPIQSKSQTSSPASATAPQLPVSGGMTSFFGSLPQPSPSSQYPHNSLSTPILNQVFNANYSNDRQDNSLIQNKFRALGQVQEGNPSEGLVIEPGRVNETSGLPVGQEDGSVPDNPGGSAFNPVAQPTTNLTNHGGVEINGSGNGGPGHGPNETPVSALASRYVNDIFPSPSNFYVPQDWPNPGTGMTPIQNNAPQYFMNLQQQQQQQQQRQQNPQSQTSVPTNQQQSQPQQNPPPNQNQRRSLQHLLRNSSRHSNQPSASLNQSYQLPSPLQFMGLNERLNNI